MSCRSLFSRVILEHRRPRFFGSLLFVKKLQNDSALRCEGSADDKYKVLSVTAYQKNLN